MTASTASGRHSIPLACSREHERSRAMCRPLSLRSIDLTGAGDGMRPENSVTEGRWCAEYWHFPFRSHHHNATPLWKMEEWSCSREWRFFSLNYRFNHQPLRLPEPSGFSRPCPAFFRNMSVWRRSRLDRDGIHVPVHRCGFLIYRQRPPSIDGHRIGRSEFPFRAEGWNGVSIILIPIVQSNGNYRTMAS